MRKTATSSKTIESRARAWIKKISKEFGIDDAGGTLILEELERALVTELRAEAVLAKEGHSFSDRFGQRRAHPLAAVARDARAQVLASLKALNLDLEPLRDGPGRPAGGAYADES